MSDELLEFVLAIDDYKRVNKRPFPSWSEVFEVIRYLGYRKVATRGDHIDRPGELVAAHDGDTGPQSER